MSEKNNKTLAWRRYEAGRSYNNRLTPNQYRMVNANTDFYSGNQWINMPNTPAMARLPKPTFNIIKRIVNLFVAFLTSSGATVRFEPLAYYDGNNEEDPNSDASEFATSEVENLFEKFGMEYRIREALFDGAVTGDYAAHFYYDPTSRPYGGAYGDYSGEIKMEMVDGLNVMFGNPNTPDVESQPYILVLGRGIVADLREEAKRYRKDKFRKGTAARDGEEDLIQPDSDFEWQSGHAGKVEIEPDDDSGKCLYVYMYTKVVTEKDVIDEETGLPKYEPELGEDGKPVEEIDKETGKPAIDAEGNPVYKMRKMRKYVTSVHVTKATKSCVIYEDVDTGLSRYPLAWGNWEHQKNQYHGRALVTGIIPNQIAINTLVAMSISHQQKLGFPTVLYNGNMISQWNNEVGKAIRVTNLQPNQSISQVATNLAPADMSAQIIQLINTVMSLTKECLGATDVQMGNVKPDNTSAIMVMQSNSQVPLENPKACLYEWLESIGHILLDMMGNYYGERPIVRVRTVEELVMDPATGQPVIDPMTGQMRQNKVTHKSVEMFDFSQLKNLWLNVRTDVGAASLFSEIAMTQTLDNLRRDGVLETVDYLERIPDKLIPKKAELIQKIKDQLAVGEANPLSNPQPGTPVSVPNPSGAKSSRGVPMAGGLGGNKNISEMPDMIEAQFNQLPTKAQNALMKNAVMNGGG